MQTSDGKDYLSAVVKQERENVAMKGLASEVGGVMSNMVASFKFNLVNNLNQRIGFPSARKVLRNILKVETGKLVEGVVGTDNKISESVAVLANDPVGSRRARVIVNVYNKFVDWEKAIPDYIKGGFQELELNPNDITTLPEGFTWQSLEVALISYIIPKIKRQIVKEDYLSYVEVVMKEWLHKLPPMIRDLFSNPQGAARVSSGRRHKRRRHH